MKLHEIQELPYGKIRRQLIIRWFTDFRFENDYTFDSGLPVNRKHQFQTKDLDIKYLIKKGVLEYNRVFYGTPGRSKSNQTTLVLTNEYKQSIGSKRSDHYDIAGSGRV
jgi:hypothetical protein